MTLTLSLILSALLSLLNPGNVSHAQTQVQADVTVEPSVTPLPSSVQTTETPEDSPTPTISPTVTPVVSPTPDVSVTPTPVATVTPTPTMEGDKDKDDMININADVHAFFGLMNAAFHHETNEDRSEQKHDVRVDETTEVNVNK